MPPLGGARVRARAGSGGERDAMRGAGAGEEARAHSCGILSRMRTRLDPIPQALLRS